MTDWRERLRIAIQQQGVTHAEIARRAGIAPETLSRILSGTHSRPQFSTVIRLARAVRVSVGELLDEPVRGIELTKKERDQIRAVAVILFDAFRRAYGER